MKRRKWTTEECRKLIDMKSSGMRWNEIAKQLRRTSFAAERRFNLLQKAGEAPYTTGLMFNYVDEIIKYCQQYGHRKTLLKFGSYAIHFLRRNGLWHRKLKKIPAYVDQFMHSSDRYYWAGFIAADGCIRSGSHLNIGLAKKDSDHLEKLQKLAGGAIYYSNKSTTWSMHNAKIMVDFLSKLNITPRKSKTLKPPVGMSQKQSCDFIRGYIDGDGCFTSNAQKWNIYPCISIVGTKEFLEWVRNCLKKWAKCKTFPSVRCTRGIYVLSYGSRHDFASIGKWIYKKHCERLTRKFNRFQQILNITNEQNAEI